MSRKPTRQVVMARCEHDIMNRTATFYTYQDPDNDATRQVVIEKIPHEYDDGDILVIERTKTKYRGTFFVWKIIEEETP